MANKLFSPNAEWSTWWDHSWYSGVLWFSAQHYGKRSQSHDWAASLSQPKQKPLVQSFTHLHRLQLPPHSFFTQVTGHCFFNSGCQSCLQTPTHKQYGPAPPFFGMLFVRLLRAVSRSKMPPHNSLLPNSSKGTSSSRHYSRDPILFSNLGSATASEF